MRFQSLSENYIAHRMQAAVLPNPLNSLLSLFAATILADEHSHASADACFKTPEIVFGLVRRLGFKIPEARLLYWYGLNKAAIQDNLNSVCFKQWYDMLLDELADMPGKALILATLRQIISADKTGRVNGKALLILTERYWQQG